MSLLLKHFMYIIKMHPFTGRIRAAPEMSCKGIGHFWMSYFNKHLKNHCSHTNGIWKTNFYIFEKNGTYSPGKFTCYFLIIPCLLAQQISKFDLRLISVEFRYSIQTSMKHPNPAWTKSRTICSSLLSMSLLKIFPHLLSGETIMNTWISERKSLINSETNTGFSPTFFKVWHDIHFKVCFITFRGSLEFWVVFGSERTWQKLPLPEPHLHHGSYILHVIKNKETETIRYMNQ